MTPRTWRERLIRSALLGAVTAFLVAAKVSLAQVAITEVMANPSGDDAFWEWIEIRNTTGSSLNLNNWIFDDDDDANVTTANIRSTNGNTVVPAGGVAVMYPADKFNYLPQRFLNAWGSGITLIPVAGFGNGLANDADAIGLWSSLANYNADTIASTTSPRRAFAHAVTSLAYGPGTSFPAIASGRSIAWSGNGDVTDGAAWAPSVEGSAGAFVSQTTVIDSAPLNSSDDQGGPGVTPSSPTATGLRFSEIMFAPKSPLVSTGYAESDFEWIEVANRTGAPIDFNATPYVLDDAKGAQLNQANITAGALAAGDVGVFYKLGAITPEQMEAMWGSGINYIPVNVWPSLTNSGANTIAIWNSKNAYDTEPTTGVGRTHQNAIAAVTYDTTSSQGWPSVIDGRSIRLRLLTSDPNLGANWTTSFAGDGAGSKHATTIYQQTVDNPGGEVGSPGLAPAIATPSLSGDYNGNGTVDAADYVAWREAFDSAAPLPNDTTPGSVTPADYDVWRANFGRTAASGSGGEGAVVPEPTGMALILGAVFGWHALSLRRRARRQEL